MHPLKTNFLLKTNSQYVEIGSNIMTLEEYRKVLTYGSNPTENGNRRSPRNVPEKYNDYVNRKEEEAAEEKAKKDKNSMCAVS